LNLFYKLYRDIAFLNDAESIHLTTLKLLKKYPSLISFIFKLGLSSSRYSIKMNTGDWNFPIGLAAGLDKNAECLNFFSRMGFGAVEVGTVTPLPQKGNERPRLFRLEEQKSLLNRMGFNNDGIEVLIGNIKKSKRKPNILGINIGKNKCTSEKNAWKDYYTLYEKAYDCCDYLVINVSSPNTPDLRKLQNYENLKEIFNSLVELRKNKYCPLYLKISPDLEKSEITEICELVKEYSLSGIVATNTTIMPTVGEGGVSGYLLKEKARKTRDILCEVLKEDRSIDIIGVGGFDKMDEILNFWKKGGRAVQIYSAFIYQGPQVLKNIKKEIDIFLDKNHLGSIEELIENIQYLDIKDN